MEGSYSRCSQVTPRPCPSFFFLKDPPPPKFSPLPLPAALPIPARPRRFLALDAISWGLLLVVVFALTIGRLDREYIGVLFVIALAIRLAPAVLACVEADQIGRAHV